MDSVQKFARVQGYAVSIKFSITGKRVYLKCDRGTLKPQNQQDSRQRQTSSSRADCPFLLSGNYSKRRGNWKLNVLQCSHNHDPSLNPSGHSAHRKLTSDQAEAVKNMPLTGIYHYELLLLSERTMKGLLQPYLHSTMGVLKCEKAFRMEGHRFILFWMS